MEFIDDEHELFWEEKSLLLQKYEGTSSYYKALVYTLGICETTRNNFYKIFDIKKGEINIDSINCAFQTNESKKVTRMAFSLFNGCNYDSEQDIEKSKVSSNYNVNDIFCCSYAPYFFEAVKIRFPEYFREQQNNRIIKLAELDSKNNAEKYGIYIRSNSKNNFTSQIEIQERKEFLINLCEKDNYNVTHIYIDEGFSGKIDTKRISFKKMLEDINDGKIQGIVAQSLDQLIRENFVKTKIVLEQIKDSGGKLIIVDNGKLKDITKINEQIPKEISNDLKKVALREKRKNIKNRER